VGDTYGQVPSINAMSALASACSTTSITGVHGMMQSSNRWQRFRGAGEPDGSGGGGEGRKCRNGEPSGIRIPTRSDGVEECDLEH
jgi:hypothetical protein